MRVVDFLTIETKTGDVELHPVMLTRCAALNGPRNRTFVMLVQSRESTYGQLVTDTAEGLV